MLAVLVATGGSRSCTRQCVHHNINDDHGVSVFLIFNKELVLVLIKES